MSYLTRAMKSKDPRYARIARYLGRRRNVPEEAPDEEDDLKYTRRLYHEVVGKRPYHGWDVDELLEKIEAADES